MVEQLVAMGALPVVKLKFSGCVVASETATSVAHMPIATLSLHNCDITVEFIEGLVAWTELTCLELHACHFSQEMAQALVKLPKLADLALINCRLTDDRSLIDSQIAKLDFSGAQLTGSCRIIRDSTAQESPWLRTGLRMPRSPSIG